MTIRCMHQKEKSRGIRTHLIDYLFKSYEYSSAFRHLHFNAIFNHTHSLRYNNLRVLKSHKLRRRLNARNIAIEVRADDINFFIEFSFFRLEIMPGIG